MTPRHSHLLWPILVLSLGLLFWPGAPLGPIALAQSVTPVTPGGYYYVVQIGDRWAEIAARNGLTLAQLQAANPTLLRPGDVLWPGDRLFIPVASPPPGAPVSGYWYTVQAGDTWQIVARDTGVPVPDLWYANPAQLYQRRWLYIGTRLWIPAPPNADAGGSSLWPGRLHRESVARGGNSQPPTVASSPTITATAVVTATPEVSTAITATAVVTATPAVPTAITGTAAMTATLQVPASITATAVMTAATGSPGPNEAASAGGGVTAPASCPHAAGWLRRRHQRLSQQPRRHAGRVADLARGLRRPDGRHGQRHGGQPAKHDEHRFCRGHRPATQHLQPRSAGPRCWSCTSCHPATCWRASARALAGSRY